MEASLTFYLDYPSGGSRMMQGLLLIEEGNKIGRVKVHNLMKRMGMGI